MNQTTDPLIVESGRADHLARQDVIDKIMELCEKQLTAHSSYLLSSLGLDLGPDPLLYIKLTEKTRLRDFISQHLSNRYSIQVGGEHNNVYSVARSGSHISPIAPLSQKKFRYHYRFWAAFAKTSEGNRRFLDLNGLVFENRDTPPPESPSIIEISSEFLTPDDIPDRDGVVEQKIERWLEQRKLIRDDFSAEKRAPGTRGAPSPSRTTDPSILEMIIKTLDKRQLQSITMPLDVVATLLGKYR